MRLREPRKTESSPELSEQKIGEVSDTLTELLKSRADKRLVDKLQKAIGELTANLNSVLSRLQATDSHLRELSDKESLTTQEIASIKGDLQGVATAEQVASKVKEALSDVRQKLVEAQSEPLAQELSGDLAELTRALSGLNETVKALQAKVKEVGERPTYIAGGGISASGTPAENEYARFDKRRRLEGRTYSQVKADLDLEAGTDFPSQATFDDHSARHEDGGADEISIAGLSGTPAALTTHEAAVDPHTGYRLESADHTHQSAGAQAGKIDHGLALDGLTDDDHTQYIRHALATAANDFLVASGSGTYVKKTLAETLTILLSAALAENDVIKLVSALSADGKYSSSETFTGTAGTALAFGDVVYLASADSKWEKAKGDAEATISPMTATVVVGAAENGTVTLMRRGFIREDDWTWATVGAPIFISAATAGAMTLTELTTGQFQKVVGFVMSADHIYVDHSPDWVKVG